MRRVAGKGLTARRGIAIGALIPLLVATLVVFPWAAAHADAGNRVDLRVLVFTSDDPSTAAISAALGREGVPYTTVNLSDVGRPPIDAAFLTNAAAHEGKYQAIVLPNAAGSGAAGLTTAERDALAAYERGYGVRQVDSYDWPGTVGPLPASYSGPLDGNPLTVTPDGLSGPFSYLTGSLAVDNFDPSTPEVYGFPVAAAPTLPAGQTFIPLLSTAAGGTSGAVVGVYSHDSREELVITANFNDSQQWFNEISHGLITWMTRGVHLGYQRNYFAVQVDDVFLADSRWSATGHCTPGDGCADPTMTTPDIRMTSTDVANLVNWQNANGFHLDLVFNGGGSDLWKADQNPPATVDPTLDAFTAPGTENQFTWINHTYTHEFLGCIQVAPTVAGGTWHCATPTDTGPYFDPDLVPTKETPVDGIYWMSQAEIDSQIQQNQAWARTHHLTNFDPTQLVTGEHSGLKILPQQPDDSPFLAGALADSGIAYTASDASREPASRQVGTTSTVPRHPMNIFYNAGTYGDEVSEYNWIYTATPGGSGICTNNLTSSCITPLPDSTAADARASFDGYIKPIEIRNAMKFVLTNDPRPFYAHQSNLTEDRILFPVMQGVLDQYTSVYDTAKSPLVHLDLKGQSQALSQMSSWTTDQSGITAYVDLGGVHVSGAGSVPVTVPTGSIVTGGSLSPYSGEQSGWITAPAADSVVAVPPTPAGGYVPAAAPPAAPAAPAATAGNASATVTWAAPADTGGAPITGYKLYSSADNYTTAVAAPTASPFTLSGLTNGTAYAFKVSAVNATGEGPLSAASNSVTPAGVPAAPTIGIARAGNGSATVRWTAPTNPGGSPIIGYKLYSSADNYTTAVAAPTASPYTVTGLTNGITYTFKVSAVNATGEGPLSAASNSVTPATVPVAPTIGTARAGNTSATATWIAPTNTGGSPITGYRVRVYVGTGTTVLKTVTVGSSVTSVVVTGLTNGTGYSFTVAATNAVGTGAFSTRSAVVTPAGAPTRPNIGTATPGVAGGAITAVTAWSPPASDGGSPITGYRVTALRMSTSGTVLSTTTSAVQPATSRSLEMTLPATGNYRFTVQAINAIGTSPQSARSNLVAGR